MARVVSRPLIQLPRRRSSHPTFNFNPRLCDDASSSDSGEVFKSRNDRKRETRSAVRWGMELANFSPPQIKRILRVAALEQEVYDALMLVKDLISIAVDGTQTSSEESSCYARASGQETGKPDAAYVKARRPLTRCLRGLVKQLSSN